MGKISWKNFMKDDRGTGGSAQALKGGAYSLIVTAVVLAILVLVNVFVSILPKPYTRYDISASKLYSITSNTKAVVNALEKDVTIYWIVQSGEENEVIENLLGKYESLSEHIKVVKKNPDVYPAFASQYTDGEVLNNSLVVECGDRNRYIGYNDIFLQEPDLSTYTYRASFDGEGAVTSAIDYVINEEQPKLYLLEGHGEEELPSYVANQIEKENMEKKSLSLLTENAVPEDASCVLIYAPQSDISDEEETILSDYVKKGGKLMVVAGPVPDKTLKTLYGLLEEYGVKSEEGVVIDTDREHFAFQTPYILLPDIGESKITDPLRKERYHAIMPIAQGLSVMEENNGASVTELLTTSDISVSKADGFKLSTFETEEGDAPGSFTLAVSIEGKEGGQIVWFSSSRFLDEAYNAYSSGANLEMAMNSLSSLIGEREAVAIRSKSLNYNYLTISDSAASFLKAVMIGIFPLVYLGVGIFIVVKRRRQNETA